jgi:hypothetical protein
VNSQKSRIKPETLNSNQLETDGLGIPKRVLGDLKRAGANVTKLARNKYFVQNIRFGDAAWDVLATFAESSNDDPLIYVGFFPSPDFSNSCMAPSPDLENEIVREARSIVSHYVPLMASDFSFDRVPLIPGPLQFPPLMVNIRHPNIALVGLHSRIRNPGYPTLTAIRPGCYVCTIIYIWRNTLNHINVHKL